MQRGQVRSSLTQAEKAKAGGRNAACEIPPLQMVRLRSALVPWEPHGLTGFMMLKDQRKKVHEIQHP